MGNYLVHQLVTFCGDGAGRFHTLVQFLREAKNHKAHFIKYSESPGSIKTTTYTYPAPGWMAGVTLSGGQGNLWRKAGFAMYPKPCFRDLNLSYRLVKHWMAGGCQACPRPLPLSPAARTSDLLATPFLSSPPGWGAHGGGDLTCPAQLRPETPEQCPARGEHSDPHWE